MLTGRPLPLMISPQWTVCSSGEIESLFDESRLRGHGRRATMLSDYTFAVRSGDGFANVGKAYSGLTDEEVRQLTRLLRSISTDRFGRVVLVRPEVVLEVAFDGVQKSPRHKGGFALRFPRIIRWRRDKEAADVDHIDRVRELYESSMNLTPHRG